jgi:hypothetical protein
MVQGPGISSYSWSTGSTSASTTVSPIVSTIYTVQVRGNNTCKSTQSVNVVVENCTSIFENLAGTEIFKIFPNPTKTNIVFQPIGELNGNAELIITNLEGNKLLDQWINQDLTRTFPVDISNYPPGVYFFSVYIRNERVQTQSIIIQK